MQVPRHKVRSLAAAAALAAAGVFLVACGGIAYRDRQGQEGQPASLAQQQQSLIEWGDSPKKVDVSEEMYKCLFKSDMWNELCRTCCKTLYIAPGAEEDLPMNFEISGREPPAGTGLPYGVRFGDFVGNGNSIVFNGANAATVAFVNRYFGWTMQARQAPKGIAHFNKRVRTYVNGDPNPPPRRMYEVITRMEDELPNYPGTWVVSTDSLPQGTKVIYDNAPAASPLRGNVSPAFSAPYCTATDPSGGLNKALPIKVEPGDCPEAAKRGLVCTCGHVIILGWTWEHAHENTWDHSLIFADDMARIACKPGAAPPAVAPMPTAPPARKMSGKEALEIGCRTAPEYDPGAQQWFYMKDESDGGKTLMVRHWCKSDWVPQESWYKYQRYVPRQLNNKPPPPINDFDFMNSYAQMRGEPSHGPWGIDDFTLGNAQASVRGGGGRGVGGGDGASSVRGRDDDNVRVAKFDDSDVVEPQ